MQIILLENLKNLGNLGKTIKVKPGFARNYLLPTGKAVLANKDNLKYFEEQKEELQKKEQQRINDLQQRADKLNGIEISISALASDEGKLYGSIGINDIVDAINATGVIIKKQEIILPHGGIKELGLYELQLSLNNGEIIAAIGLRVVAKDKH